MGMMEDGAKVKSSTGPRVEPVADLREAKGEVNRGADGRTTSGGSGKGKDSDFTSSGRNEFNRYGVIFDVFEMGVIGEEVGSRLILLDLSRAEIPNEILIDILPSCNGIYYHIKDEFIGARAILKIVNAKDVITSINLMKIKGLEFIVRDYGNDGRKMFMWIHCGTRRPKFHEIIYVDSYNAIVKYKTTDKGLQGRPRHVEFEEVSYI